MSAISIPRDKHAAGISNLMRALRRSWIPSGGSGAPDVENPTDAKGTTLVSRPGTTPGEPPGPTTGAETGARLFTQHQLQQQLDEALVAQLSMLHARARQADEEIRAEEEAKAQEGAGAAAAAAAAPAAANTRKRGVYSSVFDQLLEIGE